MEALGLLFEEATPLPYVARWFAADGVVVVTRTVANVYIGGTLIGSFDEAADDRGPRNVLAVTLAASNQFHLGRLAEAFGIGDEYLRRLRRKAEAHGLGAVVGPRQGKVMKVAPEVRAAWCAMFEAGQTPTDAHVNNRARRAMRTRRCGRSSRSGSRPGPRRRHSRRSRCR